MGGGYRVDSGHPSRHGRPAQDDPKRTLRKGQSEDFFVPLIAINQPENVKRKLPLG
jgi:hypothetical protein